MAAQYEVFAVLCGVQGDLDVVGFGVGRRIRKPQRVESSAVRSDSVVTSAEPCESVGAVTASGHCAQRCLAIGGTEDFDGDAADRGSAVRLDGASDRARVCRQCLPCRAVVSDRRFDEISIDCVGVCNRLKAGPDDDRKDRDGREQPGEGEHPSTDPRPLDEHGRTLRWQFNPVSLEGQRARHRGAEPWTSAGDFSANALHLSRLEPNGDGIEAIAECLLVVGPEELAQNSGIAGVFEEDGEHGPRAGRDCRWVDSDTEVFE